MRVHLHYRTTDGPWGGTNSFARALAGYLSRRGVSLSRRPAGADVVLVNGAYRAPGVLVDAGRLAAVRDTGRSWPWLSRLLGPARRKPRLVLRLDGLRAHYAGEASEMDRLQLELARLADGVVFQSRYGLELFRKAGYEGQRHTIIHNGVDGRVFHPGERRWDGRGPLRVLASSWSQNAAKGHADVAAFAELPGVEVRFVGRWPENLPAGRVKVEPPLAHPRLAEAYRWADAFLFPARREACPNAVLEAMASGLPVWYHPEGGTAEIAAGYGVALTGSPADDLERMRRGHAELRDRLTRDRERFTIEAPGAAYLAYFEEVRGAGA